MKFLKSLLMFVVLFTLSISISVPTQAASNPISPKDSRVTYIMKDMNGVQYKVFFAGVNETKTIASYENDTVWAGANEGDVLYSGNYKFYIQKVGTGIIKDTNIKYNDYTLNATRKMVHMYPSPYKGQPDIVAVSETWGSNSEVADLFYIKNGKLTRFIHEFGYTKRLQLISKNKFLYATYNNGDGKWRFATLSLNPKNGTIQRKAVSYKNPSTVLANWKTSWK